MNWCWTDKFHSEQISNSFSSFKPSAHFKVLISNIHCSKIERNGLLRCTRFTNQILYPNTPTLLNIVTLLDVKSQFYGLISRMQRDPQNTTLRIRSAEGRGWGQAGGSQKSVTPSFPKFWIVFLNTFWRKKQVLYGPKTPLLAFWPNFVL